jgi:hypothetical protein
LKGIPRFSFCIDFSHFGKFQTPCLTVYRLEISFLPSLPVVLQVYNFATPGPAIFIPNDSVKHTVFRLKNQFHRHNRVLWHFAIPQTDDLSSYKLVISNFDNSSASSPRQTCSFTAQSSHQLHQTRGFVTSPSRIDHLFCFSLSQAAQLPYLFPTI